MLSNLKSIKQGWDNETTGGYKLKTIKSRGKLRIKPMALKN